MHTSKILDILRIFLSINILVICFSLRSLAEIHSDTKKSNKPNKTENYEESTNKVLYFQIALNYLYSYILQFESEILPELSIEEREVLTQLKLILKQDAISRKSKTGSLTKEGILKLKLSSDISLFEKPEGTRMAVTASAIEDPIWINDLLINNERELVDYLSAIQLLIHEIGHKIPNENVQSIYKISTLLRQRIENRMQKFDFEGNSFKIFFIESDKILIEELPNVDKSEIIIWDERSKEYSFYPIKSILDIDKLQSKNLHYRTSLFKEVFSNFGEGKVRFTVPFIKEFAYLKETTQNEYRIETIVPKSNFEKYSVAHDLVIDLTSSNLFFEIENGSRLSLSDRFTIESMNLKTKFLLITGVLHVENLHSIYESLSLNLELPKSKRVELLANDVEFLNKDMARVHFRLNLKEPSVFHNILINHITLKTNKREIRRILLPNELKWNRLRSQPQLDPIAIIEGRPIFDPISNVLSLDLQTNAKHPFLSFNLILSNKSFFAEGDTENYNERAPMHVIESYKINQKNIKQTLNKKGIFISIKVPITDLVQDQTFIPRVPANPEPLKSLHEIVGFRLDSDIVILKYVDAFLRTENIQLTGIPTISLYGSAKLNVQKNSTFSGTRCETLFKF